MHEITVDRKLQDAIDNTHLVYFKAEGITQNLIWEQYHYLTDIKELFKGNSALLKDTLLLASSLIYDQPQMC